MRVWFINHEKFLLSQKREIMMVMRVTLEIFACFSYFMRKFTKTFLIK